MLNLNENYIKKSGRFRPPNLKTQQDGLLELGSRDPGSEI